MNCIGKSQMRSIPASFIRKKQAIISALAISDTEYTDLSPKGSVDEGIKDLIKELNGLDGIVTTSSCAGRISVFLEGSKSVPVADTSESNEGEAIDGRQHKLVPGGKGRGGRWLFVSHDPVPVPKISSDEEAPVMKLFGLAPQNVTYKIDPRSTRLVKFQFEPMVQSIYIASLVIILSRLTLARFFIS